MRNCSTTWPRCATLESRSLESSNRRHVGVHRPGDRAAARGATRDDRGLRDHSGRARARRPPRPGQAYARDPRGDLIAGAGRVPAARDRRRHRLLLRAYRRRAAQRGAKGAASRRLDSGNCDASRGRRRDPRHGLHRLRLGRDTPRLRARSKHRSPRLSAGASFRVRGACASLSLVAGARYVPPSYGRVAQDHRLAT